MPETPDPYDAHRPEASGEMIGPYRILRELGRGGQGIVYFAEDTRIKRRVALKVLRGAGIVSVVSLGRFRREAEAASRLDHPGICAVHEAALDGHVPYIAMRYVEGESLAQKIKTAHGTPESETTYVSLPEVAKAAAASTKHEADDLPRTPSSPTTRADVMRVVHVVEQAARALHAAHEAGVIHRDIKPGNIMVTPDGQGVVMDFGLAHLEEPDQQTLTQTGDFFGTPAYMSPEQLLAQRMRLDCRTDVWSLGVTLYECLTLTRPFDAPTREGVYHSIQSKNPADPRRLNTGIPDDLKVVLECALEKDRDRRYATALAFAEDLRRVREYEPILARPVSPFTRLMRWSQRNPALAASVFGLFVVLVVGLTVALILLDQTRRERDATARERDAKNSALEAKDKVLRRLEVANAQKDAALGKSEGLRLLAASAAVLARNPELALLLGLEGASMVPSQPVLVDSTLRDSLRELRTSRTLIHPRPVTESTFSPDGQRVVTSDGWTARVWDAATGKETAVLRGHELGVCTASFSPDGRHVVTASGDKTARIWNTETGKETVALRGHEVGLSSASFSPDGKRVLTASWDKTARMWNAETGKEMVALRGHESGVTTASFSPDGRRVVTASWDKTARIWDGVTGKEMAILRGHEEEEVMTASFSPDGGRVLTASFDRTARVWDAQTGKEMVVLHCSDLGAPTASFSPDGHRVLTSATSAARIWDAETGKQITTLEGHGEWFSTASFSPDGRRVVTASRDKTARIWDAETGKEMAVLLGHEGNLRTASFSSDGRWVLTASDDKTARIWDTWVSKENVALGPAWTALFSPDGRRVVTASGGKTASIWDAETGRERMVLRGHDGSVDTASFGPDGRRVVTTSYDKTARIWDSETGKEIAVLRGHAESVATASFSPDGRRVVTASDDKTARIWDAETGKELMVLRGLAGIRPLIALFSPDGRRVVTSDTKTVRIWEPNTGMELIVLDDAEVSLLPTPSFSPDGSQVVVASRRNARVLDTNTGKEVAALGGTPAARTASFSRDGRRVVTASYGPTARIWDAVTGKQIALLSGHDDEVMTASFSPDGRRVLTASWDKTARIWDPETGTEMAVLRGHDQRLSAASFSPDGQWVVTVSNDETARMWPVDVVAAAQARKPRDLTWQEVQQYAVGTEEDRAFVRDILDHSTTPPKTVEKLEHARLRDCVRRAGILEATLRVGDPESSLEAAWLIVQLPGGSDAAINHAIELADWARSAGGRPTESGLVRGVALLRLGKAREALEALPKAQRVAPEEGEWQGLRILAAIAMCQYRLGQQVEAATTLGAVDGLKPEERQAVSGWIAFLDEAIALVHGTAPREPRPSSR